MMAPPKPNGFYMFMKEQQEILKRQTGITYNMKDLPGMCKEAWNAMSKEERNIFDMQAKKLKKGGATLETNFERRRKDNQRQYIVDRVDPVKENQRRRLAEIQKMRMAWDGQDLKKLRLYLVNFQVMYIDHHVDHRLPVEIGMVCLTMKDGIVKDMHQFIDPGEIPVGYRSMSMEHSEATHQIPFKYENADNNYSGLWQQIEEFISPESDGDMPPIFCLSTECHEVQTCLDFIYSNAATTKPNKFHKIYCLEDLASSLIVMAKKNTPEPSKTQLQDALQQNRWDYCSEIRCNYHEEVDSPFCSKSIVKRYSFALFDSLSNVMDFKLTSKHLPDEKEAYKTSVFRAPLNNTTSGLDSPTIVTKRLSNLSLSKRDRKTPRPNQLPVVNRIEIQVSWSDSQSSDCDDCDDEVLYSEEVKSTADQYDLKELRKPNTISLAEATARAKLQPGSLLCMGRGSTIGKPFLQNIRPGVQNSSQSVTPSVGRGLLIGRGRAASSSADSPGPAKLFPVKTDRIGGLSVGRGLLARK